MISKLDDIAMIILALVSGGILVYESTTVLTLSQIAYLDKIDIGIAIAFLVESFFRLLFAEKKKEFLKSSGWELLAAIPISSTPTQAFRLLRLLRLVRLLRLSAGFQRFWKYIPKFIRETYILAVSLTWSGLVSVGTIAFYTFEHLANPHKPGMFDSLWWAVGTITTDAAGDVYPVTIGGRVTGMLLMICGIGTSGIFTALVASFFLRNRSIQKS